MRTSKIKIILSALLCYQLLVIGVLASKYTISQIGTNQAKKLQVESPKTDTQSQVLYVYKRKP